MRKLIILFLLLFYTCNFTSAWFYDYSKENREKYYFNTFITNEVVFENKTNFKYINSTISYWDYYNKYWNFLSSENWYDWIYKILENNLWYNNFKKLFLSWDIWILWQWYYNFDLAENKNYDNFLDLVKNTWWTYYSFNWKNFITDRIEVNSDENKKLKIKFYPFVTNNFLSFYNEWISVFTKWYPSWKLPKLTVVDNSIVYKDISFYNWKEEYKWILKYKLDKFYIDRDLLDEVWPEYIYQIVPYYEFEIDLNKWKNYLEIKYPFIVWYDNWEYTPFFKNVISNYVNQKLRIRNEK